MTSPRRARLLGVFAHPDDESFCVGGTFAKYMSQGHEGMVLTATRGEAGQIRDAGLASRRSLGDVRQRELEEACKVLGIQHLRFLDHHDGSLATVEPEVLADEVHAVMQEFAPSAVFTFDTEGLYGHPDHVGISVATGAAFYRYAETRETTQPSLYHCIFPRQELFLLEWLARWLTRSEIRFKGGTDFVRALSLFSSESMTLGYAADHVDVSWFPRGIYIVEQGEAADSLYLILSGEVDVVREESDGLMSPLGMLGSGEFFGELAIAGAKTRTANVIARSEVTCLVLSRSAPTAFAPRGVAPTETRERKGAGNAPPVTTVLDVSAFVPQKVAAIAAHRTQYPIGVDTFPIDMMQELLGREYFNRVHPPPARETDLLLG